MSNRRPFAGLRLACLRPGRVVVICAAVTMFAAAAFAGDISGIWTGQMIDRNGDPQDLSFRFVQNEDALTGKMYGDNESTPIEDSSLSGDQITFKVTTELNGAITTFVYTGTIAGNEMEMTRKRVGIKPDPPAAKPPDPKAAAANSTRPPQNQKFHLKRLA